MKKLVWTKGTAQPETKLGFYRDIATVETTNGVYRFGYTCTGKCTHPAPPEMETASLEADKMSLVQAMLQSGERRIDDLGVGYIIDEDSDALPYSKTASPIRTCSSRMRAVLATRPRVAAW